MKAILISPDKMRVEYVVSDQDIKSIYRLLGCETFQAVYLNNGSRDMLYLDDEGKINGKFEKQGAFEFDLFPGDLLVGRALIMGVGPEGENADPKTDIREVANAIRWSVPLDWLLGGKPDTD